MLYLHNYSLVPAFRCIALTLLFIGLSGCGGGGSSSQPTNVAPVASNSCSTIVNNDPAIVVSLSASDSNGNGTIASYTIDTLPTNGSISGCVALGMPGCTQECASNAQCASFTYTPNKPSNLRGMDKFNFHVTDSGGLSSSMATVWILNNGQVRIMPLGDSITVGSGDPNNAGFRRPLFQQLETLVGTGRVDFVGAATPAGSPPDFDRNHEGHGGWCDDAPCGGGFNNIDDTVQGFLGATPSDIVLLHIGTNDFDESNVGVNSILNKINVWAQQNYPMNVFVARIIPTRDGTLVSINNFNNNVTTIATNRSHTTVRMVNQQTGAGIHNTSDPTGNTGNPAFYAENLHPNPAGYALLADKWRTDLVTAGVLPSCP
jgi:lysophospholipase L1-like esterase